MRLIVYWYTKTSHAHVYLLVSNAAWETTQRACTLQESRWQDWVRGRFETYRYKSPGRVRARFVLTLEVYMIFPFSTL